MFDLVTLPTVADVTRAAADRVVQAARTAIEARGRFTLALAGGRTPKALYEQLAADPAVIDWSRVHLGFGDERCVAPDHPDSNFATAHEALIRQVPIPADQVHRMPGEIDPEIAAADYARTLESLLGPEGRFDLILLGMGPDGHTASLFPGSTALDATATVVATDPAPLKPHVPRLTLTFPTLAAARARLLLVTGADKAEALDRVLTEPSANLPIQRLPGADTTLLLDADAASRLTR